MATKRAQQLQQLAAKLPGANQRVAEGLEAARQTQLQQAIKQAPTTAGTAAAQQLGAQQAAQAGATGLQTAQQTQRGLAQVGQLGLQQAGREQRQKTFERGIGLTEKQREQAGKLASLGRDIKNEMLDKQLDFQRDRAGNALFNERQLADYAIANAQSDEELANYMQDIQQVHNREMDILETSYKKLSNAVERGVTERNKKLTREQRLELDEKRKAIARQLKQKQNEAANRNAVISTLFTLGGTAAGAVVGGPAGAGIGAGLGSGVGSIVGALS